MAQKMYFGHPNHTNLLNLNNKQSIADRAHRSAFYFEGK